MTYDEKYFDGKWTSVIKEMPSGGNYYFHLRQYGMNIVKGLIADKSSVFDYACGLGVIDKQLRDEKKCKVSGCDFSQVAIDYVVKQTGGNFRKTSNFFCGPYDYILAVYFLEHIIEPQRWVSKALKYADRVICVLPNDFDHHGEHIDMQWSSWEDFAIKFSDFFWTRIDNKTSYPVNIPMAFRHPIIMFSKERENE